MAFAIWSAVDCIFWVIAWRCWHAKAPVGFFTSEPAPQVKDIHSYNRAVARLWMVFAALLEVIGIPLLFAGQNNPRALLVVLAVPMLVIGLMVAYFKVMKKHQA